MTNEKQTVKITTEIFDALVKLAKKNHFGSVDEYVDHLLGQMIQHSLEEQFDPDEEKMIKEKLEKLGYL